MLLWNHFGFLLALIEEGLIPRIIAGSSGGSIVAAALGYYGMENIMVTVDITNRASQLGNFADHILSLIRTGHFINTDQIADIFTDLVGRDTTLLDAYRKTGIVLNITVSSSFEHEMPKVLNHITAPEVLLWSAVLVSSAFPGLVTGRASETIWCRDNAGRIVPYDVGGPNIWFDGSFVHDIGGLHVRHLFNITQIIVAQINIPFLLLRLMEKLFGDIYMIRCISRLILSELRYRYEQFHQFIPHFFKSCVVFISQQWYGDVTCIPYVSPLEVFCVLSNFTPELLKYALQQGRLSAYKIELSVVDSFLCVLFSVVGGVGGVCWEVGSFWATTAYANMVVPIRDRRRWRRRLTEAKTFSEWAKAAHEIDRLEGKENWKSDPVSPDYDYELVQSRLEQLQSARKMGDQVAMSFLLRTSISRDFGGINSRALYENTLIGTKHLIEEFRDEIIVQLGLLGKGCEEETNPMELKKKMMFFRDLRHTLGNTAFLLSGGGSIGLYHIGVLKCLYEANMVPRIVTGASAGSIMLAFMCCRSPENWPDMLELNDIDTHFFEEAPPSNEPATLLRSLGKKVSRFLESGVVYDTNVIRNALRSQLGDITFLESYRKSGVVFNVAISTSSEYDMPRLLNYITSPNVLVWSAVVVSCSVPVLFEASQLMAKEADGSISPWNVTGDRWIDGSLDNDLPIARIAELFNVNRFIVSQVNPHINPVLRYTDSPSIFGRLTRNLIYLSLSEVHYRANQLESFGILSKFCHVVKNMLGQRYAGDITIIPEIPFADIIGLFYDWDHGRIMRGRFRGEKAAWPKMTLIKTQLQTELVLDEIILRIRNRLVDFSNQVNDCILSPLSSIDDVSSLIGSSSSNIGVPEAVGNHVMAGADDYMLDPRVDIRRHLSPDLSASQMPHLGTNGSTELKQPSNVDPKGYKDFNKSDTKAMFTFVDLECATVAPTSADHSRDENKDNYP